MRDWQDKQQERENYVDSVVAHLSTEDLKSAVKRRVEQTIEEKISAYRKELERALND